MAKRKAKALDKMDSVRKSASLKLDQVNSKIGKLNLKKGSVALFAICEIADNHLIVNHSRNTKGYISLKETIYENNANKYFKIGQYINAFVISEIG
jgi:ribosomal protein S1